MKGSLWLEGTIYKTPKKLFNIKHNEYFWRNVFRVMHSYLRGASKSRNLEIKLNGASHNVRTNSKGHFKVNLSCDNEMAVDLNQLQVSMLKENRKIRLQIPEPFSHCYFTYGNNKRAVISDIDDTVLVTHTLNTFRKARTLLVKNAHKRKAVKEMKDLYQQFDQRGYSFFYVSNSESNLFPLIRIFLEHNHFPIGPIFLKPFVKWNQIFKKKKRSPKLSHKKEKITYLITALKDMEFTLIGDDSQKDPEIYADISKTFPGRIKQIYIRSVKKRISPKRLKLQSEVNRSRQTDFVFFKEPKEIMASVKNN
jgi:phosphatidate phosphatase APP1